MPPREPTSPPHAASVPSSDDADLSAILHEMLDGVIELQHADFGTVQLLNRTDGTLEIAASRGVGRDFVDHFRRVDPTFTSPSGRAFRERVIVEDVETDPAFVPYRSVAAAVGFRGVQSTPLLDRGTGAPVGLLSTHFLRPHRPSARELRLTDVYTALAADLIACHLAERRLRTGHEHLRSALSAARVGIWEWNVETGLVTADAAHRALFGLEPNDEPEPFEVYGARVSTKRVKAAVAVARAALENGSQFHTEQRIAGAGGTISWVQLAGRGMRDDRKTMIGVSFDITPRKSVEETLRESEARLQAAVDLLDLGLYSWDPRTHALRWDARVRSFWGLAPDAAVDYDLWLRGVHPEDRPAVLQAVERSLNPDDDGVYEMEYRVIGVDGVERWVATRGRTSFTDRQPDGFLGVVLDITGRKRAEKLLADSEGRLAGILDQLPAGIGLYDLNGRLIQSNAVLRQYMASEVLPSGGGTAAARWRAFKPDGGALDPADYPGARALRGETVVPGIDFIHTAENGRRTWMHVTAAPFRDQAGATAGVVTVLQNIDEQKRSEQAVRESDERFRQFADHSSQVLWVLGAGMRTEYLSRAYESIWGRPRDAGTTSWIEATYPDDRESVLAAREKAFHGERMVHQYRIVRADDAVRWIRETVFPIRDEYGRVPRIGGVAQDVTGSPASMVYIVDADEAHRQTLLLLFQQTGYGTKAFTAGTDLLDVAPVLAAGCVVLHPGPAIDAIALLKQLKARGSSLPAIVLGSSGGNVTLAVEAMKAGAVDWLEVPYAPKTLLAVIAAALAEIRETAERDWDAEWTRARISAMSVRERQVLDGVMAGGTNKTIGRSLGISPRTVELHRASVMERLGARTLPEAVLKAAAAGLRPPFSPRKSPPAE